MTEKTPDYSNLEVKTAAPEEFYEFLKGKDYNPMCGPGLYDRMKKVYPDTKIFGGYVDGELKIAMVMRVQPAMRILKRAYSPYGYITDDYKDMALVEAFFDKLKPILSKANIAVLHFETLVEYQEHNPDGSVKEGGFNNQAYRDAMEKIGFIPQSLKAGYDTNMQARWISILELADYKEPLDGYRLTSEQLKNTDDFYRLKTEKEVLKGIEAKKRSDINYCKKPYFKIEKLTYDELPVLKHLVDEAGEKHHFETVQLETYQDIYNGYKEDCEIWCVYLDLDEMRRWLDSEKEKNAENLEKAKEALEKAPDSSRKQNKVKALIEEQEILEKREAEYQELSKTHSGKIPMNAAVFLFSPTETLYLYSGSSREMAKFRGSTALQWKLIQEAMKRKCLRYNFLGISGIFDPEDPGFGVFNFKKGFGARVAELSGEMILPIRPVQAKIYLAYEKAAAKEHGDA